MTCARCNEPADELAIVADSSGETATVCLTCGAAWLAEVLACWDASLPVWRGNATAAQLKAHERALRAAAAADKEKARRQEESRQRAREAAERREKARQAKQAARIAEAEALRGQRARIAARFVQANGQATLQQTARAVGVSTRTLSRITPLAIERGWIITGKLGLAAGPVSVPRDADRADLDAAEERCWAAAKA